jgi:hypothetical protein
MPRGVSYEGSERLVNPEAVSDLGRRRRNDSVFTRRQRACRRHLERSVAIFGEVEGNLFALHGAFGAAEQMRSHHL